LYTLREPPPYGDHFDRENEALRPNNTVSRQTNLETTKAYPGPTPKAGRSEGQCQEKYSAFVQAGIGNRSMWNDLDAQSLLESKVC
jgi:hypothetical protein